MKISFVRCAGICLLVALVIAGLPRTSTAEDKYKGYTFEEWRDDVMNTRMETSKRVRAIEALTQFGSRKSDTENVLVPMLNDADLRGAATAALKKIGSSQAGKGSSFTESLSVKYNGYTFNEWREDVQNTKMERSKRERAIEALTHFRDRKGDTEKALVPLLKDTDLRDAASLALVKIGSSQASRITFTSPEKYNGYTFEEWREDVQNTKMERSKRERAIEAVTHFPSRKRDIENALIPLLDDTNLKAAATRALDKIRGR